jgi:hypothetical protein
MSLLAVFRSRRLAHDGQLREVAGDYREQHRLRLRQILEAGRWTIHDLINSPRVQGAVRRQWRVTAGMEEDHAVEGYIAYLEYIEAVSRGVLPERTRPRPSLFSL